MMRLVRDQDSSATAGIRKRLITAIAADYKTPDVPVIDSMKRLILVTSRKRWLQLTIILALVIPQLAFLPVQSLPTLIPWTLIHENHDASVSLAKHSLSEMSSYKLTETALKRPSQNNSSTCLVSPTESHDAEIPFGTPRFWIQICIIFALLLFAALMAGLTIGIIGLDMNTLFILKRSGTPQQQRYAEIVEPLRRKGHLLLCTLLIGNMMANEAVPILLDQLLSEGSGVVAIVASTALIVLFAEIIPQSICSRYGLAIAAHTSWFIRLMIFLFYPVSWPISKLLSFVLGNHEGVIYRRSELKELVTLHGRKQMGDLNDDEVKIIKSVLDLRAKTAAEIMTPLHDVFMIDLDTVLDRKTMEAINLSGFSRIPVYTDGMRSHIAAVLLVKRLLGVDADKGLKVRDVLSTCTSSIPFYSSRSSLFALLNRFQEGRAHMAAIYDSAARPVRAGRQREDDQESVCSEVADTPPNTRPPSTRQRLLGPTGGYSHSRPPVIGVITLEDIIEEIIGEEIIDETDVFVDVRTKQIVPNRPPPIAAGSGGRRTPWRFTGRASFPRRRFVMRRVKRKSAITSNNDPPIIIVPISTSFPPPAAASAGRYQSSPLAREQQSDSASDRSDPPPPPSLTLPTIRKPRERRRTDHSRRLGRQPTTTTAATSTATANRQSRSVDAEHEEYHQRLHEALAPFFGAPPPSQQQSAIIARSGNQTPRKPSAGRLLQTTDDVYGVSSNQSRLPPVSSSNSDNGLQVAKQAISPVSPGNVSDAMQAAPNDREDASERDPMLK